MLNFMFSVAGRELPATLFLAGIGAIGLIVVVLIILAFREEKSYNNDTLPELPGVKTDVEEPLLLDVDEESAFDLDDDDFAPVSGNAEAENLLKDLRASAKKNSDTGKRRFGLRLDRKSR
jgi:hypothetical protein